MDEKDAKRRQTGAVAAKRDRQDNVILSMVQANEKRDYSCGKKMNEE